MSCHPYAVITAQRLLPVLRSPDADAAVHRAAALLAAGCRAVELTTTTPGWAEAVRRTVPLADARGRSAVVGVGTVATARQAETALAAGAAFLVSPYPAPEVREVAERRSAVFIEGGFTPGEVAAAARSAGAAKVFPAHVGGPQFIRSLKAVLPEALIVPTGGIRPAEVPVWLAAGAAAVGIGSGLPDDPGELAAVFAELAGPCCAACEGDAAAATAAAPGRPDAAPGKRP
ncbi:bifunctional 4-hydroxy-2-oxoglutarate aldolase/2-dehydro-3-deoxy-phosphogluconate aldolase [Streptomyces subrutilus]|uniref:2-keto-3-deoxy-phosphogluconate aldolase n=1 Tax=Streptomyces subrutilus TaxID=36818 RepID=A0A918QHM5_9ACTN|nr:bifunctional 4-hydroxy-2-oxoglutarate aldolase/2-dehydro-3-deoxy-phosphogluconate aldolase [Streptomyces subrutilus]WSJ33389.1 bifunctional 4-hydroxy-2-oxoglutarate aldolase/2-dehydro-3-deoxy-phosphogluconate aldolase [Streptomyces subrutilus]GGZ48155.1 2-keto-3-deoxy-phosphogluconate aldolase [Streptomyces subrutilus]